MQANPFPFWEPATIILLLLLRSGFPWLNGPYMVPELPLTGLNMISAPHPFFVPPHPTVEHQGATPLKESSESEARRGNGRNRHRVSQENTLQYVLGVS